MSRQWQHNDLRARSSPDLPRDYRTLKTEEFDIPERIEELHATYDEAKQATFLTHPKAHLSNHERKDDLWLLINTDGACYPSYWEKSPSKSPEERYLSAFGVYFGPASHHNFSELVKVDIRTNPVHKAQVTSVLEAMRYLRAAPLLKDPQVTKVVVMIDSSYVVSAMTDTIRKWRTSGFHNWKGGLVANHKLMETLDKAITDLELTSGRSVEFWYKHGANGGASSVACRARALALATLEQGLDGKP